MDSCTQNHPTWRMTICPYLSFCFTICLYQSFPEEIAVPCLSNVSHRQNQTQKMTPRFSLVDHRTLVPMHQGSLFLFLAR